MQMNSSPLPPDVLDRILSSRGDLTDHSGTSGLYRMRGNKEDSSFPTLLAGAMDNI